VEEVELPKDRDRLALKNLLVQLAATSLVIAVSDQATRSLHPERVVMKDPPTLSLLKRTNH